MESFTIDRLANSGVPFRINGKEWFVTQLTLRDQGKLQAVIKSLQPNPLDAAIKATRGLTPDLASQILRDARKEALFWPSAITSEEGLSILFNDERGQKAILKAALGRAQECSDEDIESMIDVMSFADFMRLAAIAISGKDPENDPKA